MPSNLLPRFPSPSFSMPSLLFSSLLLSFSFSSLLCPLLALPFSPPPGNSISIHAIVTNGEQTYQCNTEGEWEPLYKNATLIDARNQSNIVGYYENSYDEKHHLTNAGTWTLINNDADRVESGRITSSVMGKKLVAGGKNDMGNFLAQASKHKNLGAASRISYISQFNSSLLSPLPPSPCKVHNSTVTRNFKAVYVFWTQDVVPPQVPIALSVQDRLVEPFFGQGVVKNVFNGRAWEKYRIVARLYDLPGGSRVGGFTYNHTLPTSATTSKHGMLLPRPSQNDSVKATICIDIDDPDGFRVCGVQRVTPVAVESSSLAWSLFHVTNNTGNLPNMLGPFSFIQMVSTRGGEPPPNSTHNATLHQVWRSPFTAIFWLYTNKGN